MNISSENQHNLVHHRIERQALINPDHVAIDEGDRRISYGQLIANSKKLATILRSQAGARNGRIGILIENSIEAYTAILASLFADCCYVPLGTAVPPSRLHGIMEDADIKVLVTVKEQLATLQEVVANGPTPFALVILDAEKDDLGQVVSALDDHFDQVIFPSQIAEAPPLSDPGNNIGEDLAYIIFTSGTTGKPKGVMISHGSLRDFIDWAVGYLELTPSDRVSNHPSIHFDLSIIDIFGCLAAGATLCPITKPGDRFLPGRFINSMEISVWVSVPSVLATMKKGKQLKEGAYTKHLRAAVFCGEALAPDLTQDLQKTNPQMRIHNLYGPTEATCACTHLLVDADSLDLTKPVPIGQPNCNTDLFVLQEDKDELAKPNEIGRLMIGGSQLAHGYWNRDELTASVFTANPLKKEFTARMYETGDLAYRDAEGMYHYIGRSDLQVKIQGYRVELSEIEIHACKHASVVDAGACVLQGKNPEIALGLILSAHADSHEVIGEVAALCKESLPPYMIPKHIHILESMPKSINGKKDRKQLLEHVSKK